MDHRFTVRNSTGEDWPAFGMARLGEILEYDGVHSDIPVYTLVKPDDEAGIYVVNGAADLPDGEDGGATSYTNARYVLIHEDDDVAVGTPVGAVEDQWEAGLGGAHFLTKDEKSEEGVAPVIPLQAGSGLTIRFRISASYFCGECYADAQVISVPHGVALADLPEVTINEYGSPDFGGNTVRIYDRTGCFFNEPPEQLVNRMGYATYMTPLEDGPCSYTLHSAWDCISLCCAEEACA